MRNSACRVIESLVMRCCGATEGISANLFSTEGAEV